MHSHYTVLVEGCAHHLEVHQEDSHRLVMKFDVNFLKLVRPHHLQPATHLLLMRRSERTSFAHFVWPKPLVSEMHKSCGCGARSCSSTCLSCTTTAYSDHRRSNGFKRRSGGGGNLCGSSGGSSSGSAAAVCNSDCAARAQQESAGAHDTSSIEGAWKQMVNSVTSAALAPLPRMAQR
eukprot:TRINITY_DN1102_c1_g1_i1.p2 TRINITY_DN1102_c1_g1~~TRINITY_DN1102_c1_g1_i1.p2  ORF type:complete len:178 (-),score=43.13 TRINITY_DN1102_c1_g1_i1:310-843(-)